MRVNKEQTMAIDGLLEVHGKQHHDDDTICTKDCWRLAMMLAVNAVVDPEDDATDGIEKIKADLRKKIDTAMRDFERKILYGDGGEPSEKAATEYVITQILNGFKLPGLVEEEGVKQDTAADGPMGIRPGDDYPDETKLQALRLAVDYASQKTNTRSIVDLAKEFEKFLRGDTDA